MLKVKAANFSKIPIKKMKFSEQHFQIKQKKSSLPILVNNNHQQRKS